MIFKRVIPAVLVLGLLVAAYFWLVLHWSYSSGERAGWIQKLSDKGWICKTWEGELALVSMPGAAQVEKFAFTAANDEVAAEIVKLMGRRVSLHYEERVGLPTSCFGDTRHFVTKVTVSNELSGLPGFLAPALPGSAPR
jgi:hypothetical protein